MDLLAHHSRHQPAETSRIDLVQQRQRNREREAVLGVTRIESIAHRERVAGDVDCLRELLLGHVARVMTHQVFARHVQKARSRLLGVDAPFVERRTRADSGRNDRIEERDDVALVDQHVLSSRLVLEIGDLGEQSLVVLREWRLDPMLAQRECFAQERIAREHRVDAAEADAPSRHQRDPVKRNAFDGYDFSTLPVPVRLEIRAVDAIAGHLLDPLGLDARGDPTVQTRRIGELADHQPLRALAVDPRRRMQMKAHGARAEVRLVFVALQADVAEETGEERAMDPLVTHVNRFGVCLGCGVSLDALGIVLPALARRRQRRHVPSGLAQDLRELSVNVAPLA